jgi:hypothetical protein
MKICRVAAILLVLSAATTACAGRGARAPTTMLTGTMVVTDAPRRQFRVSGNEGVFTAPKDTPLAALDGRYVQVEIEGDGRVEQISDLGPSSH